MRSTTWLGRASAVAAAVAVACLPLSAQAQADDGSYLAKLREDGISRPLPDGALVQDGHLICTNLRRGVGPTEGAERYFPTVGMPQMISVAQSELCPDTIG